MGAEIEAPDLSPLASPETALQLREQWQGALALMTERQRRVFLDRIVMGYTPKETAERLGKAEADLPLSSDRIRQLLQQAERRWWAFDKLRERARPRPETGRPIPNRLDLRLRNYLRWFDDQADRMTIAEHKRHVWHSKRWHIAVGLMNGRYIPTPKLVGMAVMSCHVQWWHDLAPPGAKRPTCKECDLRQAMWAQWLRHGARRRLLEPIGTLASLLE